MSSKKERIPISIDVGLKAGLEIKAEVPKNSVARVVDSLTDIIRPFTEARGLRADQIRLQREDVLIEIAKKARIRAEIEGAELHPIPLKMLIQFLEKASAEDADTEMYDRWAALLLAASKEFHSRHLTFLDIMSRVSSEELKILEDVCLSCRLFPESQYPNGHLETNNLKIRNGLPLKLLAYEDQKSLDIYVKFFSEADLIYGRIMHASVKSVKGHINFFYEVFGTPGSPGFSSLEILSRERLIELERIKEPGTDVEVAYFNVTYLGLSFVRECCPKARDLIVKRAIP
jgi:hypothetical protein